MTKFITTIGYTVYFTSRERLASRNEDASVTTLAHEYVHAKDASKATRPVFSALYLFPQLIGIFALLSWLVLGPLMLFGVLSFYGAHVSTMVA